MQTVPLRHFDIVSGIFCNILLSLNGAQITNGAVKREINVSLSSKAVNFSKDHSLSGPPPIFSPLNMLSDQYPECTEFGTKP